IFILCADSQGLASGTLVQGDSRRYGAPLFIVALMTTDIGQMIREVCIEIGAMPILVRTDSSEFASLLEDRYGGFVAAAENRNSKLEIGNWTLEKRKSKIENRNTKNENP